LDPPAPHEEARAAGLQFVRKSSGFNEPSKASEGAFQTGSDEVAAASSRLLHSLETNALPRNREEEAAKAKARAAARFGDCVCRTLRLLPATSGLIHTRPSALAILK